MSLTKTEMEQRVELLHEIRRIVYDLEKARPISCFKMFGDAYTDFGVVLPNKLEELNELHMDLPLVEKMLEQKEFTKAIVLGCDYVALFFLDDNAVVFKNTKFVKAIEDMFLRI